MNKVDKIEKQIISLLSDCLSWYNSNDYAVHPIAFFEASKSIIGLNINSPSLELLNFL